MDHLVSLPSNKSARRRLLLEPLERRDMLTTVVELVKDISPLRDTDDVLDPAIFTEVGASTFFIAASPTTGIELWKTDGTAAGTSIVRDIQPGSIGSYPVSLTNVDGTLFFRALGDDFDFTQLWKSDGTEAGTVLVKDVNAGGGTARMEQPIRLRSNR